MNLRRFLLTTLTCIGVFLVVVLVTGLVILGGYAMTSGQSGVAFAYWGGAIVLLSAFIAGVLELLNH